MPNLGRLIQQGVSGVLMSTIPPLTAPAWSTFLTGVNPGSHGVYEFGQYKSGSYNTVLVNSRHITHKTLWQILSDAGKKIISVSVPLTYPPPKVNGYLISGMLTPNTNCTFTYPPELSKEILREIKNYKIVTTGGVFARKGLVKFVEELIDTETKRINATRYLMGKGEWDVAMVHILSVDILQHQLYPYLEGEISAGKDKERVEEFFRAIDKEFGRIQSALPDNCLKIVMSDHGFGPSDYTVRLNNFLIEKGLLVLKPTALSYYFLNLARFLLRFDKFHLSKWFYKRKRRDIQENIGTKMINWEKTKAFVVNGSIYGHIYINLKGREPLGVVNPGSEYEELRDYIAAAAGEIKNPETNKPVVAKVYRREEVYSGPKIGDAPDLIIVPEEGYYFRSSIFQDNSKIVTKNRIRRDLMGTHQQDGIMVFSGPFIKENTKINKANLVDIFPTILYCLGLEVPDYCEGRVLLEAFNEVFQERKQLHFKKETAINTETYVPSYSQDDEKVIEQRLRELGYLE